MKVLYTAEVTSEGGRHEGRAQSSDGRLDVRLEPPAELGGPEDAQATNPEQLLAASWAACFHSAMKTIAGMKEIDLSETLVVARVSLCVMEGSGLGLTGELHVTAGGLEPDVAEKLVRRAHRRCPVSNALAGIEAGLYLNGEPLAEDAAPSR